MNTIAPHSSHERPYERHSERRSYNRRAADLVIQISSGVGTGPTKLSAFDDSLLKAGVANYNLIRLSSVIPEGSRITQLDHEATYNEQARQGNWGDRLFAVWADSRVETPGIGAWAGIGWAQDESTGMGLFVEHEGNSEDYVRRQISLSLGALMAKREISKPWPIDMHVVGGICADEPICALVIAPYAAVSWTNQHTLVNT